MPRFPQKLWNLIDQDRTESIKWNAEGDGLMIDHNLFTTHFLQTKTFKTSRMASFVRQLNLYGFRKVGGGPLERNDEIDAYGDDADLPYLQTSNCNVREYKHRFFNRNRPELLPRVRRISGPKTGRKRRPRNSNPDGSLNTSVKRRRVVDEQGPVPTRPPGSYPVTHGFAGPGPGSYFPASYPHLPSQYPVQLHYAQDYGYPHHPGAPEFIGQHPGCSTGAPGASSHFYPPPGYPMSYPDGGPIWQGTSAVGPNPGEGSSFYPPSSGVVGNSGGGGLEGFANGPSIPPYSASAPPPFPHPVGPPPGSFFQQPGAKSAFTPTSHLVENLLGKADHSAPGAGQYAEPQLTNFNNYGHYQHYPASGMYQEGQLGGQMSTHQPLIKQNSDETTENESTEENSEDENSQEDDNALIDGSASSASAPPPDHPPPQLSGHIESANVRHFRSAELMALEAEKNLQSSQAADNNSTSDSVGDNWLPSVLSLEAPQKAVIASQTGPSTLSYYPASQVSASTEGAGGMQGGVYYTPGGAPFISEPYLHQQQQQGNVGLPSISNFAGHPPPGITNMPKIEPPQYDEVSAAYKAAFSSFSSDERHEDDIKPSVWSGQRNDTFATMQPLVQPHYSAHEYNMQYGYFGGANVEGPPRGSFQTQQYANPGREYAVPAEQPAVVDQSLSATGPLTSFQTTVSLKMSDTAPRDVKPAGLRTPVIGGFPNAETILQNRYTMIGQGLCGQVQSAASGASWEQEPHLLVQTAFPGCHGQPASHLFANETIRGTGMPHFCHDHENGVPNVYCSGPIGQTLGHQFDDVGHAFMPASECRTPAANMARLNDDSGALNTPKTTIDDQTEARATVVGATIASQSGASLAVPDPNEGGPRHLQPLGLETEADDEHDEGGRQGEVRQEAQSPQIEVGNDGDNDCGNVVVRRCEGSAPGLGQQLDETGEDTDVNSRIRDFVNREIPETECCCGENDEQGLGSVSGRKHFIENILKGEVSQVDGAAAGEG